MKCPVCAHDLVEYHSGHFNVEICRDGCSGIWFDRAELEKVDEHTETFPEELLRLKRSPNVLIDRSKKRSCVKCPDQALDRVTLDAEKRFEIDTCPTCGGTWLDIGELELLRNKSLEKAELEKSIGDYDAKVNQQVTKAGEKFRVGKVMRLVMGK